MTKIFKQCDRMPVATLAVLAVLSAWLLGCGGGPEVNTPYVELGDSNSTVNITLVNQSSTTIEHITIAGGGEVFYFDKTIVPGANCAILFRPSATAGEIYSIIVSDYFNQTSQGANFTITVGQAPPISDLNNNGTVGDSEDLQMYQDIYGTTPGNLILTISTAIFNIVDVPGDSGELALQ